MLRFDLGRSTLKPELSTGVSPDYKPDHPPNECVFRQHQPFHPSIKHSSKFFEKNLFCKKKKNGKNGKRCSNDIRCGWEDNPPCCSKRSFCRPICSKFSLLILCSDNSIMITRISTAIVAFGSKKKSERCDLGGEFWSDSIKILMGKMLLLYCQYFG